MMLRAKMNEWRLQKLRQLLVGVVMFFLTQKTFLIDGGKVVRGPGYGQGVFHPDM